MAESEQHGGVDSTKESDAVTLVGAPMQGKTPPPPLECAVVQGKLAPLCVADNASISVCVMDAEENVVETPLAQVAKETKVHRRISTEESVNNIVNQLIVATTSAKVSLGDCTDRMDTMQSPSRAVLTKPYQLLPDLPLEEERCEDKKVSFMKLLMSR